MRLANNNFLNLTLLFGLSIFTCCLAHGQSRDQIKYKCKLDAANFNQSQQLSVYDECLSAFGFARSGQLAEYQWASDEIISLSEKKRRVTAAKKKYEEERRIDLEQIRVTGWPFYIRQNINGKIYVGGLLVTNPDGTLIFGIQNQLAVQGAVQSAQRLGLKNPIEDIPRENRSGSNDNWPRDIRYTHNDRIYVGGQMVTDHEGYLINGIDGVLGVAGARASASRQKLKDPLSEIPIRPGGQIPKPM
jgi:hypothetical protein